MSGETVNASSGCLVTFTSEERVYTESYVFNGTIDSTTGEFVSGWGTARRSVSETTTTYRGVYADVKAAVTAAVSGTGKAGEMKRIGGPFWEAVVTDTTYGEWEVVQPSLGPAEPEPTPAEPSE